jgi:DNA repair protein RecO (recombination protein O)
VRRPTSRLASALDLFSRVDVQLARGRNLDVVAQAIRLPGPRLAPDPERTAHAALVAELADRVTEDRHPMEGAYELTTSALDELSREPQPRRATAWFLMTALGFLGFAPQLDACASCGRPLGTGEGGVVMPAAFSAPAGGFLCADCTLPGIARVSVQALKVLRLMGSGDIELYRRLKLVDELLGEVERVLEAQLEHHLDRQLRSLRFLRHMRSESPA